MAQGEEVTEIGSAMSGLPLRSLGVALLRSEGAVLLKSWRPTPEAVGGGTTEVVEVYP